MNTTTFAQPVILEPIPPMGRFLVFDVRPRADPRPALRRWRETISPRQVVLGLGQPLLLELGAHLPGLRAFAGMSGPGCSFPSTQGALWSFIGGSDPSDIHDLTRSIRAVLGSDFVLREEVVGFQYRHGRDLSGYEDGTENPKGDDAAEAALVSGAGAGLDGSSFVAVQRFVHDLGGLEALSPEQRDHTIGRSATTNEELEDAPETAHVKRTAQESFEPPAFMLRRSMPWGGIDEHGLYFVAYGASLDRFERVLTRMAGLEDGIVDKLLSYTRAISGGYYWCPPLREGRIDWSALPL